MAGNIGVDYGKIQDTSSGIKNSAQKMNQTLSEVKASMNSVKGSFSSGAAETLYERFNTLSAKFPEFVEAVESYSTFLNKLVTSHQELDEANRRAASNF